MQMAIPIGVLPPTYPNAAPTMTPNRIPQINLLAMVHLQIYNAKLLLLPVIHQIDW